MTDKRTKAEKMLGITVPSRLRTIMLLLIGYFSLSYLIAASNAIFNQFGVGPAQLAAENPWAALGISILIIIVTIELELRKQ